MNKQLKYPIKYAVLELKDNGGWSDGYKDITQGFIVSKCYVLESTEKYLSDGTSLVSYKVVFPFTDFSSFKTNLYHGKDKIGKVNIPSYDANGNPYPVNIVCDIFSSYEEANELAKTMNDNLLVSLISDISISTPNWNLKCKEKENEFLVQLSICQKFEQLIINQTDEMVISKEDKQLKLLKK